MAHEANGTAAMRTRQVETRGLTTAWLEAGPAAVADGTPILLFLHGYPDSADCWSYQIAAFAAEYTVVCPYVRGAAPSAATSEVRRYSGDSIALDVLAVLDVVDPTKGRPLYVIGHDLGAVHAWNLARLLQKRCAGLVIINGLSVAQMARRLSQPRQLAKSWYIAAMQLPLLPELMMKVGARPFVAFANGQGGLPKERREPLAKVRTALGAPLNQYRAFLREAPRQLLRKPALLECPVLVIWGAEDAFLVTPQRHEFASEARHVQIRIVPGNHWLHRTQPEQVNRLLAGVLQHAAVDVASGAS